MTILDKARGGNPTRSSEPREKPVENEKQTESDDNTSLLTQVESQFKHMMAEFQANTGFSVNTGEQPVDTMIELLSGKGVAVSIAVLLSYIRYCINRGLKKEITLKIGYNKPAAVPMNFAVNEELLEEIYPGDVVEIN